MAMWIDFVKVNTPLTRKTNIYQAFTKDGTVLGEVKWYAAWRQYSFFPASNMIFEKTCLRDIAAFCEVQTIAHMARLNILKEEK